MAHKPTLIRAINGGPQKLYDFENGYGASVICHPYSYGYERGLWELAVRLDGHLCYTTPITSDVLGDLSDEQVEAYLDKIEALPSPTKKETT